MEVELQGGGRTKGGTGGDCKSGYGLEGDESTWEGEENGKVGV